MPTDHRDQRLAKIIKRLDKEEKLAAAWLYGSRARKTHRPDSDYDITIAINNFETGVTERVKS